MKPKKSTGIIITVKVIREDNYFTNRNLNLKYSNLEFENPKELKKSGATKSSFSFELSRREEKLLLSRISFYFSIRPIY